MRLLLGRTTCNCVVTYYKDSQVIFMERTGWQSPSIKGACAGIRLFELLLRLRGTIEDFGVQYRPRALPRNVLHNMTVNP